VLPQQKHNGMVTELSNDIVLATNTVKRLSKDNLINLKITRVLSKAKLSPSRDMNQRLSE
jgi:hypothetical protein